MKRVTKLLSLFLVLTLIFTSLITVSVVYAEYEDSEDMENLQEIEDTENTDYSENETDEKIIADDEDKKDTLGSYKGLVAHWKFDGDFKDSSKFKNDGSLVGKKNGITFNK